MKVWVSTDHHGHYPVGAASVVVADTEDQARALLDAELKTHGLDPTKRYSLRQIATDTPRAEVLVNGDY